MIGGRPWKEIIGDEKDPQKIIELLEADRLEQQKLISEHYKKQAKTFDDMEEISSAISIALNRIDRKKRKPLGLSKDQPKRSSSPNEE
jgi:hypothetical protein